MMPTQLPVPAGIQIGICSTNERWTEDFNSSISMLQLRGLSGIGDVSKLAGACDAFADEMNKQDIATKHDKDINMWSNLRINGLLIFVGRKPTVLQNQILMEEKHLNELERKMDNFPIGTNVSKELEECLKKLTDLRHKQDFGTAGLSGGIWSEVQPKLP